MKKVIFLDADGVLNSNRTLHEDISLEDYLISNLKELVDKTGAKIILSSSWRLSTEAVATLMDKLDKFGLVISGMTCDGVDLDWLEKYEFDIKRGDYIGIVCEENRMYYWVVTNDGKITENKSEYTYNKYATIKMLHVKDNTIEELNMALKYAKEKK